MAIAPSFNQLVGASISNSLVSTYVVDIKSCVPFSDNGISASEVSGDNPCSDPTPAPVTTSNVIRRENQVDKFQSLKKVYLDYWTGKFLSTWRVSPSTNKTGCSFIMPRVDFRIRVFISANRLVNMEVRKQHNLQRKYIPSLPYLLS